ncbi:MAG: nitroreductase family protein [Opitutales bacterium]
METRKAIHARRSVKHYDPDHRLTEAEIDDLIALARLSPTSFNIQNWRFLVITDPEIRLQLRTAAWNQAQVTDASALILICGDLRAYARHPERYFAEAPPEVAAKLVPQIVKFYDGKPQLQRDEVMRSAGIAGQTLMLAAKDMGYDTCPMIGFDPEKVAEIVNLPEDYVIGFLVTIGKAVKPAWARPGTLPREEIVFRDRFPDESHR